MCRVRQNPLRKLTISCVKSIPTVNSDADLDIHRSFVLFAQIRDIVSGFARREAALRRELGGRRLAEARQIHDASERNEAWREAESLRISTAFAEEEAGVRRAAGQRRERILRAQSSGNANLMQQARQARERWLGKLQMRHFTATRNLPVDIAAENAAHAEFLAELSARQAEFTGLQRAVRRSFAGHPAFLRLLAPPASPRKVSSDRISLQQALDDDLQRSSELLADFRRHAGPRIFSIFRPAMLAGTVLCGILAAWFLLGGNGRALGAAAAGAIVLVVPVLLFHRQSHRKARRDAEELAERVIAAEFGLLACAAAADVAHQAELQRLQSDYDQLCAEINAQWNQADGIQEQFAAELRVKVERKAPLLLARHDARLEPRLSALRSDCERLLHQVNRQADAEKARLAAESASAASAAESEETSRRSALCDEWNAAILPVYAEIAAMNAVTDRLSPQWEHNLIENWRPAAEFPAAIRFGVLEADLLSLAGHLPEGLPLPGPAQIRIPLALTFPARGSLLFETHGGDNQAIRSLNNIIFRLLQNTPPGKAAFTILDPIGLGQNFAGLMHLADFEESIINRRIWTQRDQIEERLAELNEHIEKVIQMYLRNEYATITEYNARAGTVAEKYHFLVIADFPANFSETAVKRLQSIVTSGPRCGVFTLMHWDRRQTMPDGLLPDEIRAASVSIRRDRGGQGSWIFAGEKPDAAEGALAFDEPPEPALAIEIAGVIGRHSIDANRVEVPFSQIAPAEPDLWKNDTTTELRIPIGRTGATKLQYLAIGKGTRQHALFAGKTGSGKSTLFHVIITNLALACSPDQVEFYLIDFKKGVEFKCYATHRLPHARVVAIESDREFGLSVLHRVDEELRRRGDMFRSLGVQDIAGYKRAGCSEPMPRTLLVIDEFQEFFVEDDQIAQNASLLFDRIVRQGRAFGIHVLLGSQTLGGAYTLARATLGQMVIRVALQCNEADAYLIMDDNNPAPRLLSRPGEGIYNDSAGAIEGNSPFQVVWLPDDERDAQLRRVQALAKEAGTQRSGPFVFEGNAPADIRENFLLPAMLAGHSGEKRDPHCWLGAPNAIKGPTEAVFRRQSGANLLVVGQRSEAIRTMLALAVISLAARQGGDAARIVVFQTGAGENPDFLDQVVTALSNRITVAHNNNLPQVMNELAAELASRTADESLDAGPVFVLIPELQRFKRLRHEEDYSFSSSPDQEASPAGQFATLMTEGAGVGIHLIVTLDTFSNVGRYLSRRALSEFSLRVVFQMSANDSASLIDSPQASTLGLHRALFYDESEGSMETFRPYATPDAAWLRETLSKLSESPLPEVPAGSTASGA